MNKLREWQSTEMRYINLLVASSGEAESVIEVLRVGTIQDRGLKITSKMLEQYVENFKANVYGDVDEAGNPELPVNLEHNRGSAAAGWIKELFIDPVDGDRLMARVKWTELGIDNIKKHLFKFVSAELYSKHPHHETGVLVNNVFVGLALTNTPALKSQQPLVLSESVDKLLTNIRMFKTILAEMKARAFVTKDDKAMLKKLAEELPAEEKAEVAADVAAVDQKPEAIVKSPEEVAAEAEAKKKADEEAAAAKEKETLAEKQRIETLAEKEAKIAAQEAELNTFREQQAATMLSEQMGKVMLSETNATGFIAEHKERVEKFLKSLNAEQRAEFLELVPTVKTVDLKEYGGKGGKVEDKDQDAMAAADKEAKEMAEKEKIPVHEALAKVYAKRGIVK